MVSSPLHAQVTILFEHSGTKARVTKDGNDRIVADPRIQKIDQTIIPDGSRDCQHECNYQKAREQMLLQLHTELQQVRTVLDSPDSTSAKALIQPYCLQGADCRQQFLLFKTHRMGKLKQAILDADNSIHSIQGAKGTFAVEASAKTPSSQELPMLPVLPTLEELQSIESKRKIVSGEERRSAIKKFTEEVLTPPSADCKDFVKTKPMPVDPKDPGKGGIFVVIKDAGGKPVIDQEACVAAKKRYESLTQAIAPSKDQKDKLANQYGEAVLSQEHNNPHRFSLEESDEKSKVDRAQIETYLQARSALTEVGEEAINGKQSGKVAKFGKENGTDQKKEDANRKLSSSPDQKARDITYGPSDDYLKEVDKIILRGSGLQEPEIKMSTTP